VLLSVLPLAIVLATIGPLENTVSLLLIINVFALVLAAIGPCEDSVSVHFVHVPLASEFTTVRPGVHAVALNVVVFKVSSVGRAISPVELAFAVLLSVMVVSLVLGVVRPDLLAVSMLLVLEPFTLVLGSIGVVVASEAVGLVVLPLSVVYVSVSVDETASAISFILAPVAFVDRSVDPELLTLAFFQSASVPVAVVSGSVLKGHLFLELQLEVLVANWLGVVVEFAELLLNLTDDLLGLNLLFVVPVEPVVLVAMGLEPVLHSDSSASHVASEVGLHLGNSSVLGVSSVGSLSVGNMRGFREVQVVLILVSLTASGTHNI